MTIESHHRHPIHVYTVQIIYVYEYNILSPSKPIHIQWTKSHIFPLIHHFVSVNHPWWSHKIGLPPVLIHLEMDFPSESIRYPHLWQPPRYGPSGPSAWHAVNGALKCWMYQFHSSRLAATWHTSLAISSSFQLGWKDVQCVCNVCAHVHLKKKNICTCMYLYIDMCTYYTCTCAFTACETDVNSWDVDMLIYTYIYIGLSWFILNTIVKWIRSIHKCFGFRWFV